jgi:hypothetical protein
MSNYQLNYQLLKEKIVKNNPLLLKLEDGTLLKSLITSSDFGLEKDIIYEYGSETETGSNNFKMKVYYTEKYIKAFKYTFIVLGKEPMLNDVLNYWRNKTSVVTKTAFKKQLYYIVSEWDLTKPHLKDQSSELIEWLMLLS